MTKLERRRLGTGLLFALPWLIGMVLLAIGPIGASLYYSFTEFNIIGSPRWIGLGNYSALLRDELFWTSIYNTAYYALASIPLGIAAALGLALLGSRKVRGQAFYRTIFFVPSVISGVVIAILFSVIFAGDYGILNKLLAFVGIHGPQWIASPQWSKPAFVLMSLWGAGSGMVIYLAGIQSIPQHLYEAAEIDGAGVGARFLHVTIPMLTPTIFFHLIMSIIGSFQIFTTSYVMTNGGPADSTLFYVLYVYRNGFEFFKMGYASALAWVLFMVVLLLTLSQFLLGNRWVYYETGVR